MIDRNKPLEDYTKEELLEALNSKKELDSYFLLNLVYEENRKTDRYYSCFDDFLQMIHGKTSFTRMRGFGLCASLVRWDTENRLDLHLPEMLILLEDEKPTTVRVTIACLHDILEYKPYLAPVIRDNLSRIDCTRYKDSMAPLIRKDTENLRKKIESIMG